MNGKLFIITTNLIMFGQMESTIIFVAIQIVAQIRLKQIKDKKGMDYTVKDIMDYAKYYYAVKTMLKERPMDFKCWIKSQQFS